jgi:hypothetical protein
MNWRYHLETLLLVVISLVTTKGCYMFLEWVK